MNPLVSRIARRAWLAPTLLFLLALAVRLVGIGSESIWLDEASSLFVARQASVADVIAWAGHDIHPPLYFLALHFWRVFGESEAALRSLSALAGALSVVVLYLFGRRLFDAPTGLVAALLLTVAPLHIWYSQQARMYTWLGLWVLLASYLLVLALQERKLAYWAAFAVVNALALYTHYYTVFGFLVQGLFALYWAWRMHRWSDLLRTGGAMAGSVLLFAPWIPTMAFQVGTGGGGWVAEAGTPGVRAVADLFLAFIVGTVRSSYPFWLRWLGYVALSALALLGLVWGVRALVRRRRDQEMGIVLAAIYVGAPVAAAWLISQVKPLYSERYLVAFLPGYLLLVAAGIMALSPKMLRWGAASVAVAVLAFGVWQTAKLPQNPDYRSAAAYVSQRFEPGDVAVFYPGWEEKPFGYYMPGAYPSYSWFKVPLPPDEVAASVEPGIAGYKRAWLIWSIGHYGDPQGMLKQYLDSTYAARGSEQFRGSIGVALYELTSP